MGYVLLVLYMFICGIVLDSIIVENSKLWVLGVFVCGVLGAVWAIALMKGSL